MLAGPPVKVDTCYSERMIMRDHSLFRGVGASLIVARYTR